MSAPNPNINDQLSHATKAQLQEKARRFLTFVRIIIVAAVVVISVLFLRLLGSSVPEDLSPSTEVVTVLYDDGYDDGYVSSVPKDLSLSTEVVKFYYNDNDAGWVCFDSMYELYVAARSYIGQDCAQNENCETALLYGYPMNSWCVGQITDMSYLFYDMSTFDEDISEWDVSSVTDMDAMFFGASAFNGDLSAWNVSSVMDMEFMFFEASAFNGDLSAWNVSSVMNMEWMFYAASAFNGDLSSWNVSSVMDMEWMFATASAFNGDLSAWDVSSVTYMDAMFFEATDFNQDLCAWSDEFPYNNASLLFYESGCALQDDPDEELGGPFCASSCSE